jgi:inosine/guanosine/xanthosine phosphorylase family protein
MNGPEYLGTLHAAADKLTELFDGMDVRAAVVLGSGLAETVDFLEREVVVSYEELPGFPRPGVVGHPGLLVLGRLDGVGVAALVGRAHLYEGHSPDIVALPARALALAGVRTLVLTNACGGVAACLAAGDIVAITDHLDLTGRSPLAGPEVQELGPRFPVMATAWDPALVAMAHAAAEEAGVALTDGVYAAVLGPSYETPAEVRMIRTAGADVVGMSTVTEAVAARAMGMRLAGISLVTNGAGSAADGGHEAVIRAAAAGTRDLSAILEGLLRRAVASR